MKKLVFGFALLGGLVLSNPSFSQTTSGATFSPALISGPLWGDNNNRVQQQRQQKKAAVKRPQTYTVVLRYSGEEIYLTEAQKQQLVPMINRANKRPRTSFKAYASSPTKDLSSKRLAKLETFLNDNIFTQMSYGIYVKSPNSILPSDQNTIRIIETVE